MSRPKRDTSWQKSAGWYDKLVGKQGHYYHQHVVLPGIKKMLDLQEGQKAALLDLACGQGVLARQLPKSVKYCGVDASKSLIAAATKRNKVKKHSYHVADITQPLEGTGAEESFTHATIVLALQNLADPAGALRNAAKMLQEGGTLVIVVNHPCFRIPRQTAWGVDQKARIQYRRINRYMSPLEIPIQMQPSKGEKSEKTLSYHRPLSEYVRLLAEAGFVMDMLEEWCSNKKSEGGAAKMENRAREEIPMFMAIRAIKR